MYKTLAIYTKLVQIIKGLRKIVRAGRFSLDMLFLILRTTIDEIKYRSNQS